MACFFSSSGFDVFGSSDFESKTGAVFFNLSEDFSAFLGLPRDLDPAAWAMTGFAEVGLAAESDCCFLISRGLVKSLAFMSFREVLEFFLISFKPPMVVCLPEQVAVLSDDALFVSC